MGRTSYYETLHFLKKTADKNHFADDSGLASVTSKFVEPKDVKRARFEIFKNLIAALK